jgi:nitrogen regulatory protein P-II 1
MAHLLVFVLDNLERCPAILDAWEEAGAPGVTILESTGLRRLRGAMRDDLPLLPSLRDLLASRELQNRTLFTVIEDEATLERVITATEQIIGDFTHPYTGLLFVVPVSRVLGLKKRDPKEQGG